MSDPAAKTQTLTEQPINQWLPDALAASETIEGGAAHLARLETEIIAQRKTLNDRVVSTFHILGRSLGAFAFFLSWQSAWDEAILHVKDFPQLAPDVQQGCVRQFRCGFRDVRIERRLP